MNGKQKASDVPVIKSSQMKDADGFLFGLPTRFGSYPYQIKEFFDSCGSLWMKGELLVENFFYIGSTININFFFWFCQLRNNKFVGTFFSTAAIGSGQESTSFSTLSIFVHMVIINIIFFLF